MRLGGRIELPILGRNPGGIGRAQADVLRADAQLASIRIPIVAEIASVRVRLLQARTSLHTYQHEVLPAINEAVRIASRTFEVGEETYWRSSPICGATVKFTSKKHKCVHHGVAPKLPTKSSNQTSPNFGSVLISKRICRRPWPKSGRWSMAILASIADPQTYLHARMREVLSSGRGALVVRSYGPDLATLREQAGRLSGALASIHRCSTPLPTIAAREKLTS